MLRSTQVAIKCRVRVVKIMSKSLNPLVVGLDIITVYLFFLEVKKEVLLVETVSISSFQEYIISF